MKGSCYSAYFESRGRKNYVFVLRAVDVTTEDKNTVLACLDHLLLLDVSHNVESVLPYLPILTKTYCRSIITEALMLVLGSKFTIT